MPPLYEYKCRACEHSMEVRQGIKDEKLTQCPECFDETLERLISLSSFVLVGSGWFKKDGY